MMENKGDGVIVVARSRAHLGGSNGDLIASSIPSTISCRPKTVIRGVDLRSIEDTAVIELLLTRPERKVER